MIIFIINYY